MKSNQSFASEEERVRAFVAAGIGCRATYFNYAKKLQPPAGKSALKLLQSSPPKDAKPSDDFLDVLRRRFGQQEMARLLDFP